MLIPYKSGNCQLDDLDGISAEIDIILFISMSNKQVTFEDEFAGLVSTFEKIIRHKSTTMPNR